MLWCSCSVTLGKRRHTKWCTNNPSTWLIIIQVISAISKPLGKYFPWVQIFGCEIDYQHRSLWAFSVYKSGRFWKFQWRPWWLLVIQCRLVSHSKWNKSTRLNQLHLFDFHTILEQQRADPEHKQKDTCQRIQKEYVRYTYWALAMDCRKVDLSYEEYSPENSETIGRQEPA